MSKKFINEAKSLMKSMLIRKITEKLSERMNKIINNVDKIAEYMCPDVPYSTLKERAEMTPQAQIRYRKIAKSFKKSEIDDETAELKKSTQDNKKYVNWGNLQKIVTKVS